MISPQDKSLLTKFTLVAKKIIYHPERAASLAKILTAGPDGALSAVHTVLSGIEKLKPIPPNVKVMLSVNVFMIMMDLAQEVTGEKITPEVLVANINKIVQDVQKGGQAPAPQQDPGMLAQMQEQGEPPAEEMQEAVEPPPGQDPGMLAQMQRRGVA